VAKATNLASGFAPSERASSAEVMATAAAPSLVCDELPAVTVPCAWNAGFSDASAVNEVSRRGPSSVSKVISFTAGRDAFPAADPFVSATRTVSGTISSRKRPLSSAAIARSCER
jgi:hypothetical protein